MKKKINADLLLLAAGFGTRLGELTEKTPKPLVRVGDKAIVEYNLELISRSGIERVFINLHYLPDAIEAHIGDGSRWGLEVHYVRESEILGTGGAIRNIESDLQHEVLLTLNSDIVLGPDFSLQWLYESHMEKPVKPMVTMVLREDQKALEYGAIGLNDNNDVVSFLGTRYGEAEPRKLFMYVGAQAISKKCFRYMPVKGTVFSITQDTYPKLLEAGELISGIEYRGYWNDVGTPERLRQARLDVSEIFSIS